MPGPCQMPGSYADADAQSGMGASVFEPARHQVYVTIIWSNIDDLQTKRKRRKNGAYAPILLSTKIL